MALTPQVFYCIPTYRSFDHCAKAVQAALDSSLVPTEILVSDDSGQQLAQPYLQQFLDNPRFDLWPQIRRLGVAATWNLFLEEYSTDGRGMPDNYVIIANDDVFVHKYTIEKLVEAASASSDYFFCGDGHSGNAFSLFLYKPAGFRTVGPFDERFFPAYFEDNDMAYRLKLAGQKLNFVTGATYDHIGSSTLKKYTPLETEQHHYAFRTNQQYYMDKWGGMPQHEKFKSAFNR